MNSRYPSYFHWADLQPCTTNQVYGFHAKKEMAVRQAEDRMKHKNLHYPSTYTRPFSNLGFFPELAPVKQSSRSKTALEYNPYRSVPAAGPLSSEPGCINRFDINRSYTMGESSIASRVKKRRYPADKQLVFHQSVPPTYVEPSPKYKAMVLWHTLSGGLVHIKNQESEQVPSQYKLTKDEIKVQSVF